MGKRRGNRETISTTHNFWWKLNNRFPGMVLRVLLPPEENTFEDNLHEEFIESERSGSREIPHLNDLDSFGILCDER